MTAPPRLFDRHHLAARRARAEAAPAHFLRDAVADEIKERLEEVNRTFTDPAMVADMPGFWSAHFPRARHIPDAETLDLSAGTADLILSAMVLHWANDPVGHLAQARLALRPDGLFLAALFGGQTLHELRACLAEAEAEVTGGISPRVAPMGELRDLGALLQRAGFALPVADAQTLNVTYASALHLMRDLRAMGETNVLAGRLRGMTRRAVLLRAAEIYAQSFAGPDSRITATFEIIYLTGWAPSADQPQPLRPGSAAQRLADALGATEQPLPPGRD